MEQIVNLINQANCVINFCSFFSCSTLISLRYFVLHSTFSSIAKYVVCFKGALICGAHYFRLAANTIEILVFPVIYHLIFLFIAPYLSYKLTWECKRAFRAFFWH